MGKRKISVTTAFKFTRSHRSPDTREASDSDISESGAWANCCHRGGHAAALQTHAPPLMLLAVAQKRRARFFFRRRRSEPLPLVRAEDRILTRWCFTSRHPREGPATTGIRAERDPEIDQCQTSHGAADLRFRRTAPERPADRPPHNSFVVRKRVQPTRKRLPVRPGQRGQITLCYLRVLTVACYPYALLPMGGM